MTARLLFVAAALLMAACGGGVSILPEPFTRERADGKIPVKTELIRQQIRAVWDGTPEGEAEVLRWQQIEADYNACRLHAKGAKQKTEEVFADCMSVRGYVYMYPIDAEQLHNDIEFEMDKNRNKILATEKKQQEAVEREKRQIALNAALVVAVQNGDAKKEARLIAEGANPQVAEKERKRIAAERKAEEERVAAEKKRQEEQERLRRQKELNYALLVAVKSGNDDNIAEIKRLIDDGANVNAKGKKGLTPLHVAAKYGQDKIALALIKLGAYIDARADHGFTPLHFAAGNGKIEAAFVLIKAGADIDAKITDGNTPLHFATLQGHAEMVFALVKEGAYIDAKRDDDFTPLHVAATHGQIQAAVVLINAGANVYARIYSEYTALDIAVELHGKNSKIARILREAMRL